MIASAKNALPIMPLLPPFSFLSFWKSKMEEQKKVLNPWIILKEFRALGNKKRNQFYRSFRIEQTMFPPLNKESGQKKATLKAGLVILLTQIL